MSNSQSRDPMLDMFLFETNQLIEQLEQNVLSAEKNGSFGDEINEIFRIMHTLKGNSAMMLFDSISILAHSVEDIFDFLRQKKPQNIDYTKITDIILNSIDFIKNEIQKIESDNACDGDPSALIENNRQYLGEIREASGDSGKESAKTSNNTKPKEQKFYIASKDETGKPMKNRFSATVYFEDGCLMENVRAFTVVHNLNDIASDITYYPEDIMDNNESSEVIKLQGFNMIFKTDLGMEPARDFILKTAFIKSIDIKNVDDDGEVIEKTASSQEVKKDSETAPRAGIQERQQASNKQDILSVDVEKLDMLMDLMGELVISESMVTRNPELEGLQLDNFYKASRQLRKIINDLQDVVMSIRMVPLSMTFNRMNRLVRDMNKKLGKQTVLTIKGEETEVDKNIIEHISDPIMHLIRNSMDHGIETAEERLQKGKPETGEIILEARNEGGEVFIIVRDNGKGLDKNKILNKAREHGLVNKSDNELTEKEIFSFILLPGFSTKENITEYSGRGVGMDVVMKNIEKIRGTISIDSILNEGTTITIKIPLTLAIIEGMNIKVGSSRYTIPITSIRESFRVAREDIIIDPDGNEMLMIRGQCYPIIRIHELYNVKTNVRDLNEGIMIMVEYESKGICLFADTLIGSQQVVVKALPEYIKKVRGIAGCTLLGDGSISLILDVNSIIG